jgi:hypothetical protein
MRPLAAVALLTSALVLLAGCGGEGNDEPAHPTIPGDVAESLASQAEAIATTLDAGHECEAARQADAFREATVEASENGQIPVALSDEVSHTVEEIINGINCLRPPESREKTKGTNGTGGETTTGETESGGTTGATTTQDGEITTGETTTEGGEG